MNTQEKERSIALFWRSKESRYFQTVLEAAPHLTVIGEPRETQRSFLPRWFTICVELARISLERPRGVVLTSSPIALFIAKLITALTPLRVVFVSPRYIGGEGESWLLLPILLSLLRFADLLVVPTVAQANSLRELGPTLTRRTVVVPPSEGITPPAALEGGVQSPLLGRGERVIFLWGSRGEGHFVEHVLRAVSGYFESDVLVCACGVEEERTRLESIAVGLGMYHRFFLLRLGSGARFQPLNSDEIGLEEVLAQSDLVILPPTGEDAALKAFAVSKQKVALLLGPTPEYAEIFRAAELFYDPQSVEALAIQIADTFVDNVARERLLALAQRGAEYFAEHSRGGFEQIQAALRVETEGVVLE